MFYAHQICLAVNLMEVSVRNKFIFTHVQYTSYTAPEYLFYMPLLTTL